MGGEEGEEARLSRQEARHRALLGRLQKVLIHIVSGGCLPHHCWILENALIVAGRASVGSRTATARFAGGCRQGRAGLARP